MLGAIIATNMIIEWNSHYFKQFLAWYFSMNSIIEIQIFIFSCSHCREWREFPFLGIPVRIRLIFSRSTLRHNFLFLVLVSKHEIDKEEFPFSSRNTRLIKKNSRSRLEKWDFHSNFSRKKTYDFKKFWEINSLFLKISVNKQATNLIPENSRGNCLNLDSRSHLEARD